MEIDISQQFFWLRIIPNSGKTALAILQDYFASLNRRTIALNAPSARPLRQIADPAYLPVKHRRSKPATNPPLRP
jgi:hypothetical protein